MSSSRDSLSSARFHAIAILKSLIAKLRILDFRKTSPRSFWLKSMIIFYCRPLQDTAWVAVKVLVPKENTQRIIDSLEELGCVAILESELRHARL